ncbi:type II secretion system F family protein [Novosphingobium album (ex Hu et al. 2023)]|uniref:Type II secretion system F family protein n=1 Tax=Novosphingobium album (ex Hu et al. 2023) TaxID=2930093 RepID=A0ABT0B101_9SPHN|nr:type II secretion system F family protein [Novosphingobium album (ex Hu et al. 2023)]MCJ2178707.1 type II secretion system F family protein [Novosphingobium album (ex Hu et al. 2023)]
MEEIIASSPYLRVLVLLAAFAAVAGLVLLVLTLIGRRASVRSELKSISAYSRDLPVESLTKRRNDAWTRLVDRIEKAGLNLGDTKADVLRDRLKAAGYTSPAAPRIYTLIRLLLVIALPSLFVLLSLGGGKEISFMRLYLFGSIAAVVGLYVPSLFVRAKADRRREAIVRGFPDCLDLLLVCVEAGLGLEAALNRVGKEMTISHPLVAELLTSATLRIRAGATREDALRNMAHEAGVDEIRAFSTLMIQTDKLGTSIGTALRTYAAEMREKRRMRAEEKAHRIPVLISIPLVVCMLPVMIGVLMLPAIILIVRQLMPAMSGGG